MPISCVISEPCPETEEFDGKNGRCGIRYAEKLKRNNFRISRKVHDPFVYHCASNQCVFVCLFVCRLFVGMFVCLIVCLFVFG